MTGKGKAWLFVGNFVVEMEQQLVTFVDLGKMDYQAAWDLQEELLQKNVAIKSASIRDGSIPVHPQETATRHYLLFVEHPPVFTLGKSGNIANVLLQDDERKEKGIEFYRTNRGGDITFHGPEQVVGYPILDLEKFYTDIGKYLRDLEETIILTLAEYGIKGERSSGETGVWIEPALPGKARKICAIGVRSSRWVTMHGFAFNVNTDLNYFNYIIPCGIGNKQVTSLAKELGHRIDMNEAREKIRHNFEKVFNVKCLPGEDVLALQAAEI